MILLIDHSMSIYMFEYVVSSHPVLIEGSDKMSISSGTELILVCTSSRLNRVEKRTISVSRFRSKETGVDSSTRWT